MRVYIVKNSEYIISVHETFHEATEAAQGLTRRVVVREGRHPRWGDAAFWQAIDWQIRRQS